MNRLKRSGWGLLATIVIATLSLTSLFTFSPNLQEKVYADQGLEGICIPKFKSLGGDNWEPDGWLKAEQLSRFQTKLTYKATGPCANLPGLDSQYFHENQLANFSALMDGVYTFNTVDGKDHDYAYVLQVGNNKSDDSRLDRYKWDALDRGDSGDWWFYKKYSSADLAKFFQPAEFTMSIEEDDARGPICEDSSIAEGTNWNIALGNKQDDGKGVIWSCLPNAGPIVGGFIKNIIETPDNFNIAFIASADGKTITNLKDGSKNDRNFTWCAGSFKTKNCLGKDKITGITDTDLANLKGDTDVRDITITLENGKSFPAVVAGSGNVAASTPAVPANAEDEDIGINCDVKIYNPLTWFLCPLVEGGSQVVTFLDKQIIGNMTIDVTSPGSSYNENATSPDQPGYGLYTAWSNMRTIALSLLVLVALIMVISQAISVGPFDAYTVKKVLPRVVIAVIAITLSWQITKLLIGISNDLGQGLGTLISRPFDGLPTPTVDQKGSAIGAVGTVVSIFSGLDLLGVGSFILVALVGVLIAFLVIAFRNMLVILLVILSPLALIAWVLPNTKKAWGFWYTNFTAVLLSFPIIIAFITTGRVFAKVTQAAGGNGAYKSIIIFIAYFGPYFALPAAFRLAGGAVAQIGGIANDRSKGFFDGQRKFRGAQKAKKKAEGQNFGRFSDNNKLGRGLNTVFGTANNLSALRRGRNGIRAQRQTGRAIMGAEALKNDPTINAHGQDDNFLLAVANEGLAVRKLNEAKEAENAALLNGDQAAANKARMEVAARQNGLNAARRVDNRKSAAVKRAALMSLAKTGYQFSDGEEGYNELYNTASEIAGSDTGALSGMMNEAQYHLKGAGRMDIGGGINNGAELDTKSGFRKVNSYTRGQGKTSTYHGGAAAWLGRSSVGADGKTAGDAATMAQGIEQALSNNEVTEADVVEYHGMLLRDLGQASDVNRIEIQKQIDAIESARAPVGPGGVTANGGVSPLTAGLHNNRQQMQREAMSGIDPSELDKK